jgi:DNA-binding transcriptional regulator YdaS (Cro superfamily)
MAGVTSTSSTVQVLLRQAVALIGQQALAARLGVPLPVLEDWVEGRGAMPLRTLSALVDLLAETGS